MVRRQRRRAPQIVERFAGLARELRLDERANRERLSPLRIQPDGLAELTLGVAEPMALEIFAGERDVHAHRYVGGGAAHVGGHAGLIGPDERVPSLPDPLHLRQAFSRRRALVAVRPVERQAEPRQRLGEDLFRPRPLRCQRAWPKERRPGHARHDQRSPHHVGRPVYRLHAASGMPSLRLFYAAMVSL